MLALAYSIRTLFLILLFTQIGWGSVDFCVREWENLSKMAFLDSPIMKQNNCLYLSYSVSLKHGLDTPSYVEMMRDSVVLGAIQSGITIIQEQYCTRVDLSLDYCKGRISQNSFRTISRSCGKSACQAVLTFVLPKGLEQSFILERLAGSSKAQGKLFWWQGIAQELEDMDLPYTREIMLGFSQEIEAIAGKRASSFFMGEPESPVCIQRQTLNSSDLFFLQNRCPYNASDALNAGSSLEEMGYLKLAAVFYLRAAADIRAPILARTALNRLPRDWSSLPPSSSEFLSCLSTICSRFKLDHPICKFSSLTVPDSECFLLR